MLHIVKENPFTVDVFPLSKYRKTFYRAQKKALEAGLLLIVQPQDKPLEPLTEEDLTAFDVVVFRQGSFTTALMRWLNEPVCVGVCKRNNADKDNPGRGEHLAVRRAIQNLCADEVRELGENDFDSLVVMDEAADMDPEEPFEVERVWKSEPGRAPLMGLVLETGEAVGVPVAAAPATIPLLEDLQVHEEPEASAGDISPFYPDVLNRTQVPGEGPVS